jgi:methylphosphotriester-DNA--protein-cysteine methyltransferase
MNKLATLNEYRAAQGKKPLKAWKESTAKLDSLLASLEPRKHTTLPHIARELGIDPKTARAKLRKKHGAAWKSLPEAELRSVISPSPARA